MKIVITDKDTVTSGDLSFDVFSKFGSVTEYGLTEPCETAERIRDADIILCNKTILTADNLKDAKNLKYIGLFATGYNNIDLEYTSKKGITVCNAPDYSTGSVVQHTFALILELCNRTHDYNKTVAEGDWIKSRTFSYFPIPTLELEGKTIGVVGFGSIGKRICEVALAFRMNVLVYTRSLKYKENVRFTGFNELLEKSDIVTLHCPLNEQTKGLMNMDSFSRMKQGAILINTARGPVIDENALFNALVSGKLSGAGVDVLCREPMDKDCILKNAPNLIITPHIAWAGLETRKRLLGIVAGNIEAFLAGEARNAVKIG